MSLRFHTAAERPELREQLSELVEAWPRFMLEDAVAERCRSTPGSVFTRASARRSCARAGSR